MASVSTTPIIALDVPSTDDALRVVSSLGDRCRFYKIGTELFTAAGPEVVRRVRENGCDVFLDLKLHDIPNTVRGAARSASRLGATLLTVHASGGREMIEAAVEGGGETLGILAVTVLTSFDDSSLEVATGRAGVRVSDEVTRLAGVALEAHSHGIVCSGAEARLVRDRFGEKLAVLVPGIRLSGGAAHDQRRVVTPREAVAAGASYIVVGRAVTGATDPRAAMDAILTELDGAGSLA